MTRTDIGSEWGAGVEPEHPAPEHPAPEHPAPEHTAPGGAAPRAAAAVPPVAAGPGGAQPGTDRPGLRRTLNAPRVMVAVLVLLTGLTLLAGYVNKARCTGPEFDAAGRSQPDWELRADSEVCYSDIQFLWVGREVDEHVFPYVGGSITADGRLEGGSVEYPVLTGVLMWLGALGAHDDAGFLLGSSLLLAPFALVTGWMLGRLARWRALLWAVGPPLVLYAFHNWDLAVVACAVGAVHAVHGWRTDRPLVARASVAAVLLGLGFAVKIYPGVFLLPLALYVLLAAGPGRRPDWAGALRVALVGVATVVAVNLPFVLVGYQGWRASFTFQEMRKVDITTNSIWYWGFRPESVPENVAFQHWVNWLSPTLMVVSFVVAAAVGSWRWRSTGVYPWVAVSGAMLCGFLLLHKVHSPQYTLWLVPFFVLLAVPWRWIVAYLAVDIVMDIGIFRYFYAMKTSGVGIDDGFAAQAVAIGVWGRAVLLVVLFVVFLSLRDRLAEARPEPAAVAVAV